MKNIIVPYDFSATAENALKYAVKVSQLLGAKLKVVYVHRPDVVVEGMPMGVPMEQVLPLPAEVKEKMAKVNVTLAAVPNIQFECIIKEGLFDDVIVSIAENKNSTLIVMGTEGAHDALGELVGSHTSRIAQRRALPVLSVPAKYKGSLEAETEFVFATDFDTINDWDVMELFKVLAQKLYAKINIFYVRDHFLEKQYAGDQEAAYKRLQDYFFGSSVSLHYSNKDNVVEAVENFAKSKKASLIMMIAHERGFLDDLFHKSVSKEMQLHGHLPLLTIPDAKLDKNLASNIGYW